MLVAFSDPCLKSAEAGNSKVLEVKQVGHEAGLGK